MFRISKGGFFPETHEIVVYVPDARDIEKGAPVRVRGVEAGKVVAIEYPENGDDAILLRLQLDKKFEQRLFADSTARIVSKGLLGSSYIAIDPGKVASGPLASRMIRATPEPDLAETTAKLAAVANRIDGMLADIEQGKGTAGKLLRDDSLFADLKALTTETKLLVANTNDAVAVLRDDVRLTMTSATRTLESVQAETAGVKDLVRSTKETISVLKQDAEAIKSMPVVRNYVIDEVKLLVRPHCTKDRVAYNDETLFSAGGAVLTETGKRRVNDAAAWLRGQRQKNSEIVVASFVDPKNPSETSASARELTLKRSEAVANMLRAAGAASLGTFTSRAIIPIGLGIEPPPYVEKEDLPVGRVEIILYFPK